MTIKINKKWHELGIQVSPLNKKLFNKYPWLIQISHRKEFLDKHAPNIQNTAWWNYLAGFEQEYSVINNFKFLLYECKNWKQVKKYRIAKNPSDVSIRSSNDFIATIIDYMDVHVHSDSGPTWGSRKYQLACSTEKQALELVEFLNEYFSTSEDMYVSGALKFEEPKDHQQFNVSYEYLKNPPKYVYKITTKLIPYPNTDEIRKAVFSSGLKDSCKLSLYSQTVYITDEENLTMFCMYYGDIIKRITKRLVMPQ